MVDGASTAESPGAAGRRRRRACASCCRSFVAFLFSQVGLAASVVAYSILGGFLFQAIEAPFEANVRDKVAAERQTQFAAIVDVVANRTCACHAGTGSHHEPRPTKYRNSSTQRRLWRKELERELSAQVQAVLIAYQEYVAKAVKEEGWDGREETDPSVIQWSFAGSLLYSVTVTTTIGYGHVTPKTRLGRFVTMLYAVVGIPLTFLYLSTIGNFLAHCFRIFYWRICCDVCCCRRCERTRRRRRLLLVRSSSSGTVLTSAVGFKDGGGGCSPGRDPLRSRIDNPAVAWACEIPTGPLPKTSSLPDVSAAAYGAISIVDASGLDFERLTDRAMADRMLETLSGCRMQNRRAAIGRSLPGLAAIGTPERVRMEPTATDSSVERKSVTQPLLRDGKRRGGAWTKTTGCGEMLRSKLSGCCTPSSSKTGSPEKKPSEVKIPEVSDCSTRVVETEERNNAASENTDVVDRKAAKSSERTVSQSAAGSRLERAASERLADRPTHTHRHGSVLVRPPSRRPRNDDVDGGDPSADDTPLRRSGGSGDDDVTRQLRGDDDKTSFRQSTDTFVTALEELPVDSVVDVGNNDDGANINDDDDDDRTPTAADVTSGQLPPETTTSTPAPNKLGDRRLFGGFRRPKFAKSSSVPATTEPTPKRRGTASPKLRFEKLPPEKAPPREATVGRFEAPVRRRTTHAANVRVPIYVCMIVIVSYILIGSILFTLWEGWDMLTAAYFCFITLSTIGFGDIVPGTALNEWSSRDKMVLCALWLAFGLSLLAMCFNLMQEEVKEKCKWAARKCGLIKPDDQL